MLPKPTVTAELCTDYDIHPTPHNPRPDRRCLFSDLSAYCVRMTRDGRVGGRKSTRRRLLAGLGAGFAAGLAGCGDGGDGESTPTSDDDVDDTSTEDGGGNSTDGNSTDGNQTTSTPVAEPSIHIPALERAIGHRANEIRTGNGAGLLDWDGELQAIARDKSEDMIRREYFSYTDPMGNDWGDRYRAANYRCAVQAEGTIIDGGENIARVTYEEAPERNQIAHDVVEQWRTAEEPRSDLLARYWSVHGIGVALDPQAPNVRIYVTQNFC